LTLTGQNLGQGGFASTVSTHQTDLVTLLNPEVHSRHQGAGTDPDF
jgi:hypothetical protein